MASFSAPLLFGGDVRVLTLEIFTARQRGDFVMAVTETVILAVISLGALIFFQRYEGTRKFAAAAMKGAPRTTREHRERQGACARDDRRQSIFAIVLVLPVATLVLVSFAQEGSWTTQTLPAAYTLANYLRSVQRSVRGRSFLQQLLDVGDCGGGGVAVEFLCCHVAATTARRAKAVWRRMATVVVAAGVGSVGVAGNGRGGFGGRSLWTDPSSLLGSFVLVGTFWILPVVYFLRFMPLVVRALQASMEQLDPALEEAAGSLGARAWQRFTRVTLPLVWPGAVAGTLLAFVIALGEYVASVLVFVPANRPISIAIASELRDFNLGAAAAYGVVLIVIISISMVVAGKLERLRG